MRELPVLHVVALTRDLHDRRFFIPKPRAMSSPRTWSCTNCSAPNGAEDLYCPICTYARPMDRKGVPQMFHGLVVHFNGIIPRTLKHPSHSVEWRMAERHGAKVSIDFDPAKVTTLIYRPGYERSDKVKQAVEHHSATVHCVPINWMLDSLLQSRQIHPTLYRLRSIPAVAQPTVKGNNLPHHQHPYYVMNHEEYLLSPLQKEAGTQQIVLRAPKGAAGGDVEQPPKMREAPSLQWTRTDLWSAAATAAQQTKVSEMAENEFDDNTDKAGRGIDLLKGGRNRCNPALFSGMTFALSETLACDPLIPNTLRAFGAAIADLPSSTSEITEALDGSNVTHILFHREDKKKDFMICAAGVTRTVSFCDALWAEDCLMLDELIPAEEPYIASAKLMQTLSKKRSKRG